MLFNSYAFLLGFLPAAFLIYFLAARRERLRLPALLALSLVFYAYWDVRFLPVIVLSVLGNWLLIQLYRARPAKAIVVVAITADLALLASYKYLDFFASLLGALLGTQFTPHAWALPLGISFFTFHHVMYWVDLQRGRAPHFSLLEYALYICFFPQVLAGPLVRWWEIMEQFRRPPFVPGWQDRAALGVVFMVAGLVQKVFFGDPLASIVNPLFAAAQDAPLRFVEAWAAALAFTFQVFFDFAGYSDIAIGLGLLFGVVLPQNFARPFNASSLQEFWRRWHMSLSRFLRDYLYISLGGSRRGAARHAAALLATMALAGLWHGAGATFVAWGLLHGVGLVTIILWHRLGLAMAPLAGWSLTFLFVVVTFVLFRAPDFGTALNVYQGMVTVGPWEIGRILHPRTLLIAIAVGLLMPAMYQASRYVRVTRLLGIVLGLGSVAVLIKMVNADSHEFIYFQF